MKPDLQWQAEVLFLLGFTVRETATFINGHASKPGPVNRLVSEKNLASLRASERRIARLVELDTKAPVKFRGYVMCMAGKSKDAALMGVLMNGIPSASLLRSEYIMRKELPELLKSAIGIQAENIYIPEKRPRAQLVHNAANCPLSYMNSRGHLPEWAYLTGLKLREDVHASSVGGLGSIDTSKTAVDGGRMPDLSDGALDALQRVQDARSAVQYAFRSTWHNNWAIIESVAIEGRSLAETVRASKPAVAMSAGFLEESIEPAAYCYRLSPGGAIIGRMRGWTKPSDLMRENARRREAA